MKDAKERIRDQFKSMARHFLDMLDALEVARLESNLSDSQMFEFIRLCGFRTNDIPALMKFEATLGHKKEVLVDHGVTFETIVALVETDKATRNEAIRQIEAGALLSQDDVRRICTERQEKRTSLQSLSEIRREGLSDAARRLAARTLNAVPLEADKLLQAVRKYQRFHDYLLEGVDLAAVWAAEATAEEAAKAEEAAEAAKAAKKAEKAAAEEAAKAAKAAAEKAAKAAKAAVEAAHKELRALIIRTASDLLVVFDRAFPDANLAMEDWFDPAQTSVRNEFSQCRHALKVLADGQFTKKFPSVSSERYQWSVEASLSFLAGAISPHRPKPSPAAGQKRRVELNAIDINAGIGGAALGLRDAGYRVAALYTGARERDSIASNLVGWNIRQQPLGDEDNSADVARCLTNNKRERSALHLLAGKLDFSPWRTLPELEPKIIEPARDRALKEKKPKDVDAFDRDDVLRGARRLLTEYLPEGFFLEAPTLINEKRNLGDASRALITFSELGYEVQQTPLIATMVGLPQRRDRVLIIGVKKKYAERLRLPILRHPIRPKLGHLIWDVAFPYLSEFSSLRGDTGYPNDFPDYAIAYDEWAMKWLKRFGDVIVPDTMTLAKADTAIKREWKDCGFNIDKRSPLRPDSSTSFEMEKALVAMTVPIMRRLQGLPEEWDIAPDPNTKKVQRHVGLSPDSDPEIRPTATTLALLAETTPPEIARLAAYVVRSAITGETIDLDHEARQPFSTTGSGTNNDLIGPRNFGRRGSRFNIDRKSLDFNDWRRDRLEEKSLSG